MVFQRPVSSSMFPSDGKLAPEREEEPTEFVSVNSLVLSGRIWLDHRWHRGPGDRKLGLYYLLGTSQGRVWVSNPHFLQWPRRW